MYFPSKQVRRSIQNACLSFDPTPLTEQELFRRRMLEDRTYESLGRDTIGNNEWSERETITKAFSVESGGPEIMIKNCTEDPDDEGPTEKDIEDRDTFDSFKRFRKSDKEPLVYEDEGRMTVLAEENEERRTMFEMLRRTKLPSGYRFGVEYYTRMWLDINLPLIEDKIFTAINNGQKKVVHACPYQGMWLNTLEYPNPDNGSFYPFMDPDCNPRDYGIEIETRQRQNSPLGLSKQEEFDGKLLKFFCQDFDLCEAGIKTSIVSLVPSHSFLKEGDHFYDHFCWAGLYYRGSGLLIEL